MLAMLLISAACAGLLYQEGSLWGEIPDNAGLLSVPLPASGRFFFSFMPLDCHFMPVTAALELTEGNLSCQSEQVSLVSWPGSIIEVRFSPVRIMLPGDIRLPRAIIKRQDEVYAATVYQDNVCHIAIERLADDSLLFHHTLAFFPEDPYIEFRYVGGSTMVTLFDYSINYVLCVVERADGFLKLFEEYAQYEFLGNGIELIVDECQVPGYQRKSFYSGSKATNEYGFFTRSVVNVASHEDTVAALVHSLRLGLYEEAKNYLSTGLMAQYSPEEIEGFFDGHLIIRTPPFPVSPGETYIGVTNEEGTSAKLFFFDIVHEPTTNSQYKVDNIREP